MDVSTGDMRYHSQERREYIRVAPIDPLQFIITATNEAHTVVNISLGGLALETKQCHASDVIANHASEQKRKMLTGILLLTNIQIEVELVNVYTNPSQSGWYFSKIDQHSTDVLQEYVLHCQKAVLREQAELRRAEDERHFLELDDE